MQQRRPGEDVDALLVLREQLELGGVQEGGQVGVLGGLGDGAARVAVDPPRAAARLVEQVDRGGQGRVADPSAVGGADQRPGRGAQDVLAAQGPAEPGEQADDAEQGEHEQHHRAAEDHGRLEQAVARRAGDDDDGRDQAGEPEQHDEPPGGGQPDAAGDRSWPGHRRVGRGEDDQGKGDEPSRGQLGPVGDVGGEPGGDTGEQGGEQQAGRAVGRAHHGEAEPGRDRQHQQVAERVGAGGERGEQVGVRVVQDGVDQRHPARLGCGDGHHEGVEQAVPVVPDPVPLEGGDGAGQDGVREEQGQVGVRRGAGTGQRDGVADAEQGDSGGQQPAGEPVLGLRAVGDEQDGHGADDAEGGPQADPHRRSRAAAR